MIRRAARLGASLLLLALASATVLSPPAAFAARRHRPHRPAGQPFTLAWGGDVTLGSSYGNPPDAARGLLAAVAAPLRAADVGAVNLEGTLGSGGPSKCGGGSDGGGNCFAFQAPAANVAGLRAAGVDVVNVANNHAFDFGASGQAQTIARARGRWDRVQRATGRDPRAAPPPRARRVRRLLRLPLERADRRPRRGARAGARGGGAARTSSSRSSTPGPRARARSTRRTTTRSRSARTAATRARSRTRRSTRAPISCVGSGPHVLRGIELDRGRLIAYSLGNLAGYRNFGIGPVTGTSALLTVRLGPDGTFMSGGLRSLRLSGAGIPAADPGGAAAHLVSFVSRADFGAHGVTVAGGRLVPHAGFRRAPPFARARPRR